MINGESEEHSVNPSDDGERHSFTTSSLLFCFFFSWLISRLTDILYLAANLVLLLSIPSCSIRVEMAKNSSVVVV